jgi:hypothetical protein
MRALPLSAKQLGGWGIMASKGIKLLSLSMAASVAFSTLTPVSGQEVATDVELRGSASHGSDVSSLEGIDRKILAKEMELLRLNAEFRTHYLGPQKWKKRRQKFYDATGGAIANAGDITLMSQFYRYWKNPGDGLAHKGRLEAGPIIVMVAYLTLGGLYGPTVRILDKTLMASCQPRTDKILR